MSPKDSIQNRQTYLMQLEEDRTISAYIAKVVQRRRQAWVNKNIKLKVFQVNDWVLIYSSRL